MDGIWNTFDKYRPILEKEFKINNFDNNSGIPFKELKAECYKIANDECHSKVQRKADILSLILEKAKIEICPFGWFADKVEHGGITYDIRNEWIKKLNKDQLKPILDANADAMNDKAYCASYDFGHTCPDWESILSLGIPGIITRLENCEQALKKKGELTSKKAEFYATTKQVYRSLTVFLLRLSEKADSLKSAYPKMGLVASSLYDLTISAPKDILEAMQIISVFFFFQTWVEGAQVRSLGRLDRALTPFYESDISGKRYTKEQIKELLKYFMFRFYAADIQANVPFALGGTDEQGNDTYGELSELILEAYDDLNVTSPKLHIRCTESTPPHILKKVIQMIKKGNSSFVFTNDSIVISALKALGETEKEARNYVMIGCYEPAALGKEVPCTCNGQINLAKTVEYAISGGTDLLSGKKNGSPTSIPQSYDEFLSAVQTQIKYFCDKAIEVVNANEKYYMEMTPSPIFSGTMSECCERGTDAYAGGAKYNNSSLCGMSVANAVDSVYTVKKLVFEDKDITINELAEALKANWQGYERLRLKIKKLPKYGNNIPEIDSIAAELCNFTADCINLKPNGRGGVLRTGFFSIDWRLGFGQRTAATADGRGALEPLSKNLSATVGCDKAGVTGLIASAGKFNFEKLADGAVLDIVVHPSAVRGEAGNNAMLALIKTYFQMGGMAIQFNVFDPSVLRKAQAEPQKYSTLQVRLCGWNVYFTDLSKTEQDEFIAQAEN